MPKRQLNCVTTRYQTDFGCSQLDQTKARLKIADLGSGKQVPAWHRMKKRYLIITTLGVFTFLSIILVNLNDSLRTLCYSVLVAGKETKGTEHQTTPAETQAITVAKTSEICGARENKKPLINVRGTKTYVVSPYFEHRYGDRGHIHIVSIVLRSEDADHHCLFCCEGQRRSTSPADCHIHTDHFGFAYGTADLLCSVPEDCRDPTHLAVYAGPMGEGGAPFMPIGNPEPRSADFPLEFTVCISAMFQDYNNVLQAVQALEMYRLLGVDKVAIYKTSCGPEMERVLQYYSSRDFVDIIPWPITSYINVSNGWNSREYPGDLHYYGQIAALNDCVYRFMYKTKYIALHDLDEIILPLHLENWRELMDQLELQHGRDASFEFENHVFPTVYEEESGKFKLREWAGVPGVNVLEHIHREPNIPTEFNAFKVIVNPRMVYEATVHGFLNLKSQSVRVPHEIARMYHIRRPLRHDIKRTDLIQDNRLWHYSSKLVTAVNEVLKEVDLLNLKNSSSKHIR